MRQIEFDLGRDFVPVREASLGGYRATHQQGKNASITHVSDPEHVIDTVLVGRGGVEGALRHWHRQSVLAQVR